MSILKNAGRLYHTVRHLKPRQVFGRILPEAKRRAAGRGWVLTRLPEPPPSLAGGLTPAVAFVRHTPWNTRAGVLRGDFTFLGVPRALGWPVRWAVPEAPLLWQYNLHYFHHLALLEPPEAETLCVAWTRANPVGQTVGWRAYPLSLRIVNWCKAGLCAPENRASLYRQAAFLFRNMEDYIGGNHYLENARALVFAGRCFDGAGEAARWEAEGLRILRDELPRQVLADGGTYERSPMYHALLLEGVLDLVNLLPPAHPDRPLLAETARRMVGFLLALTHPDGHLALFNDAAEEIAPPTAALVDYAERLLGSPPAPLPSFPETGYFVAEAPGVYLALDAGPVGPDHLPAHAHADIFSFELSLGGRRFVVDSGTYEYEPGAFRDHLRGTAAHNTVGVDGVDQVECWKSHRVARRYAPTVEKAGWADGQWRFAGTFDGYRHLLGDDIVHRRTVALDAAAGRLRVADTVTGRGTHRVVSRLHLHPDVTVQTEGTRAILTRDGIRCVFAAEGGWREEAGWYCPRFGVKHRTRVLVLGGEGVLPARHAYELTFS